MSILRFFTIFFVIFLFGTDNSSALTEEDNQAKKESEDKLSKSMTQECLKNGGEQVHCSCVGKKFGEISAERMLHLFEDVDKSLGEEFYVGKVNEIGEVAIVDAVNYCNEIKEIEQDFIKSLNEPKKVDTNSFENVLKQLCFADGGNKRYCKCLVDKTMEYISIERDQILRSGGSQGMKNYLNELPEIQKSSNIKAFTECEHYIGKEDDILKNGGTVDCNKMKNRTHAYCLEKIAAAGDQNAQIVLAQKYQSGNGVEQDSSKSFYWYNEASKIESDTTAMIKRILGFKYMDGVGTRKDQTKAYQLMKEAAKGGDAVAYGWLGFMYWFGEGTEQNTKKAIKWLHKSVEFNEGILYTVGCYMLGSAYIEPGPYMNKIEGYKWLMKAAEKGHTDAQETLDTLCLQSPWACK